MRLSRTRAPLLDTRSEETPFLFRFVTSGQHHINLPRESEPTSVLFRHVDPPPPPTGSEAICLLLFRNAACYQPPPAVRSGTSSTSRTTNSGTNAGPAAVAAGLSSEAVGSLGRPRLSGKNGVERGERECAIRYECLDSK